MVTLSGSSVFSREMAMSRDIFIGAQIQRGRAFVNTWYWLVITSDNKKSSCWFCDSMNDLVSPDHTWCTRNGLLWTLSKIWADKRAVFMFSAHWAPFYVWPLSVYHCLSGFMFCPFKAFANICAVTSHRPYQFVSLSCKIYCMEPFHLSVCVSPIKIS